MVITLTMLETRLMASPITVELLEQVIKDADEQRLVNDYLNYYSLPATPGMYANAPITMCAIMRILGKIGHKYEVATDYGRKPEEAPMHTPNDLRDLSMCLGDLQFMLYRLAQLSNVDLHEAFFDVLVEWEQRMGMLHSSSRL